MTTEKVLDWKQLMIEEHRRAELLRIRKGQDGCGCKDCQEFYKTLDLSVYGARVVNIGNGTIVSAGTTGADLSRHSVANLQETTVNDQDALKTLPASRNASAVTEKSDKICPICGYALPAPVIGLHRGSSRPKKYCSDKCRRESLKRKEHGEPSSVAGATT
jgi:hypothetical protein